MRGRSIIGTAQEWFREEMNLNFVALDFETANADPASVCSVGLVTVENNIITDEYYSLVKPKGMVFDAANIEVNGITPKMVEKAASFAEIWTEVEHRIEGRMVAAHYAAFDIKVLKAVLDAHLIGYPAINYVCSWLVSKAVWPGLPSYRLDLLARRIGFSFRHHDALEDARACAMLLLRAGEESGFASFEEMSRHYKLNIGKIAPQGALF